MRKDILLQRRRTISKPCHDIFIIYQGMAWVPQTYWLYDINQAYSISAEIVCRPRTYSSFNQSFNKVLGTPICCTAPNNYKDLKRNELQTTLIIYQKTSDTARLSYSIQSLRKINVQRQLQDTNEALKAESSQSSSPQDSLVFTVGVLTLG